VRALGLWLWVALVASSGCSLGESDVFTIYPDGGGECWVDKDCPDIPCHTVPSCVEGLCRRFKTTKPTTCLQGVCTEDGMCLPCVSDAQCETLNVSECNTSICTEDGACQPVMKKPGETCNHADGGVCDETASCR
jgi:hypothetical protein